MALPDINFSAKYFDEWLKTIQDLRRSIAPELSDFNDREPLVQIEKAIAAIGHALSVHADQVAIENYLPTARLRQSFINIGKLVDFLLSKANPATTDLLAQLTQVLASTTTLAAQFSDFATSQTEVGIPPINFENLAAFSTARTDQLSRCWGVEATVFTDHTVNANNGATFQPWVTPAAGDELYIGHADIVWAIAKITLTIVAANITGVWEIFDEDTSDWVDLSTVTPSLNFTDGTSLLTASGDVAYDIPFHGKVKWAKTTVNGDNYYWLRFRITSVSTPTAPTIDRIQIETGDQFAIIPVTQGDRVTDDPLGSSDGSVDQTFDLTQKPILSSSLSVEVDEGGGFIVWTEKNNFLVSKATDKHYITDLFFDGKVTVRFGDGVNGKIPLTGANNVRAFYRVGGAENGNVGADTINVNKSGLGLLSTINNPRDATGWAAAEGITEDSRSILRQSIPASLRTRNRAVSLPDFVFLAEDWTDPIGGGKPVGRAKAVDEWGGPNTVLLVIEAVGGGTLTGAQKTNLADFFNNVDTGVIMIGRQVEVIDYTPSSFSVVATTKGGSAGVIQAALKALLQPEAANDDGTLVWNFGSKVFVSILLCKIQEQAGVKWATLTSPAGDQQLGDNELPKLALSDIQITVT